MSAWKTLKRSYLNLLSFLKDLLGLLSFRYAAKVGALHFQTSAKINDGIEDMFLSLTEKMMERAAQQEQQNPILNRQNSQRRNVVVVEDEQAPTSRHCCGSS